MEFVIGQTNRHLPNFQMLIFILFLKILFFARVFLTYYLSFPIQSIHRKIYTSKIMIRGCIHTSITVVDCVFDSKFQIHVNNQARKPKNKMS